VNACCGRSIRKISAIETAEPDRDPGASRWRFLDRQGAAIGFGQAAGDGEAQSGAAGSAASRCLRPTERLEHGLPVFGRDSRAFVVDRQQKVLVDALPDARALASRATATGVMPK